MSAGVVFLSLPLVLRAMVAAGEGCLSVCVCVKAWRESLPTDSHREGSLAPISPGYYRHRSLCVGAGAVEYLV